VELSGSWAALYCSRRWAAKQKLDYAVKNWLARKDRASEITMDDLTAELRLRGLEPPYDAVKQGLATRFAGIDEATQRKARSKFAREIGMFIRESDKSLH